MISFVVRSFDSLCGYPFSVAHYRDLIGYLEDLLHLMGNVYYSAALIAQHIYYSEEMRHLILGQGRRRLIENYNLSIIRNRFRNFDHLPLRHRHFTHHGSRVDIDPEFIENLLCRIVHLSFRL